MPLVGIARWTDAAWRTEHLAWAEARLAEHGRRRVGDVEARPRPWSAVFRIPTDRGTAWSKANGPGPFHEGPLLEVMARAGERHVLQPTAVDVQRGWLLFDDGGATLRSLAATDGRNGDTDLGRWERILADYAALQRRMEPHVEAMVSAGVPDERPERLPATLTRLLDADDVWTRVDEADRPATDRARERLRQVAPVVAEMAAALAASPIAATIEHGDLHGNNILIDSDGSPRFFDWGDAVVAHPFQTLTGALGSIGHHAGLDAYGPDLDRLRDAYLDAWTDRAPRSALAALIPVAMDLGHIAKACAWERAVTGLARAEMGGHHGGTALWLADLAARLAG